MRRIILLLPLILLLSLYAKAQYTVKQAEYYFDTDPGFGNGTALPTGTPADSVNLGAFIVLPGFLARGATHHLYVRTYSDSSGYNGHWSLTGATPFYITGDSLSYLEYFFDADPGFGNGTQLAVSGAGDSINENYTIPTTGLSSGTHYLYVRSRSQGGRWSIVTNRQPFYITNALSAATEYFFDTDPGVGNGTPLATASGDSSNASFSINVPGGMTAGLHYLYVRTKSATGQWSLAPRARFYVNNALATGEYFFDTDPGAGNGTPLAVSTTDSSADSYSIATPGGISAGYHYLYVRAKSSAGQWGLAQRKRFFVNNSIVAAEYFFDTDPGEGSATGLNAGTADDSLSLTAGIKVPCLPAGNHYLYLRTKDSRGVWSISEEDTFTLVAPVITLTQSLPGPGPYGTPVKVLGSGGTGPYTYQMDAGVVTPDSIFLAANGATPVFTATDTCGYSGTQPVNTPAAPVNIATTTTGSGAINFTGWRYWVYLTDASGDIIAAVKDNGQNLGSINASYLRNTDTVRSFPAAWYSNYYLDRNWHIAAQHAPGSEVGVRLYALDSEFDSLNNKDAAINDHADLRIRKYDGPNEDLDFGNNDAALAGNVIQPDSSASFAGAATNGYFLDFRVSSFSEFYQSANPATPLFLQQLSLRADAMSGKVQVSWQTEQESDMAHYTVLRDGGNNTWQMLGKVGARNQSRNDYAFTDEQPLQGYNYYKLLLTEQDGATRYSPIVYAIVKGSRSYVIYPNPAQDKLHISGLESGATVQLMDATGRIIWQETPEGNSMELDMRAMAIGTYLLKITDEQGATVTQRVEHVD